MLKKIFTLSSLLAAGLTIAPAVNAVPVQASHPTVNSPSMQWASDQTLGAPAISADDSDQSGAIAGTDNNTNDDSLTTDQGDNDDSLNTDDNNDDGISNMGDDDSSATADQ